MKSPWSRPPVPLGTLLLFLHTGALPAQDKLSLFHESSPFEQKTWLRGTEHDDPRSVFSVKDRTVHISGEGYGYISSGVRLRNYHLKLEFKWGDQKGLARGARTGKALDSGVFLHATGPHGNSHDGDGAFMAAIECNIFEGATGDLLLIRGNNADSSLIAPRVTVEAAKERDADGFPYWKQDGAAVPLERWGRVNWMNKSRDWKDVRGFRGKKDAEKPAGDWNTLECICAGSSITIILNGVIVNKASKLHPREGQILLQCEGAEILFRNVRIETLPDPAK